MGAKITAPTSRPAGRPILLAAHDLLIRVRPTRPGQTEMHLDGGRSRHARAKVMAAMPIEIAPMHFDAMIIISVRRPPPVGQSGPSSDWPSLGQPREEPERGGPAPGPAQVSAQVSARQPGSASSQAPGRECGATGASRQLAAALCRRPKWTQGQPLAEAAPISFASRSPVGMSAEFLRTPLECLPSRAHFGERFVW